MTELAAPQPSAEALFSLSALVRLASGVAVPLLPLLSAPCCERCANTVPATSSIWSSGKGAVLG